MLVIALKMSDFEVTIGGSSETDEHAGSDHPSN